MTHPDHAMPANDRHDAIDLLMAALALSTDPVTRQYIELALAHEGRKIAAGLPRDDAGEGFGRTGT